MPPFGRTTINISFRIWISAACVFLCLSALVVRLWYLQIEHGAVFRDKSLNNKLRTLFIPAARGAIYDRNEELLVRNRPSFNVELIVEDSPDPEQTAADLAKLVGEDPALLKEKVSKQGKRRRFEPKLLLRDVPRDVVAQISAQRHRLPGVTISVVPTREYPFGELSAHVVGYLREVSSEQLKSPAFSGYMMGDVVGQFGIESDLERYLRGERGTQAIIVNAFGSKIGESHRVPDKPGSDVFLTIDRRTQAAADEALAGLKGAVVVMDVHSGEVLALASSPRYHPGIFTTEIAKDVWSALVDPKENKLSNRALQGAFPPGSVFKIFVAAAALAEGVITPKEKVYCPGYYKFGKRAFKCHKHSGHGSVSLFEAIVQSCDVYFYVVGQRLGVDRIHLYAADLFGLGEKTGLAREDEKSGVIPSTKWKETYFRDPEDKKWYPGETLSVAIGQGAVSTTPIQIARSLAAVVNGGKVVEPRLIKKVVSGDGRILEEGSSQPVVVRTVDIDPAILQILKDAMGGVVTDKRGTGHRAALPEEVGIGVGGKTGTSQVASRESGLKVEDHAWFAGFAPTNDPRVVVVALVENGGHGGVAAAPIARKVLAAYFRVPEVIEKKPKEKAKKTLPKRHSATVAAGERSIGEG